MYACEVSGQTDLYNTSISSSSLLIEHLMVLYTQTFTLHCSFACFAHAVTILASCSARCVGLFSKQQRHQLCISADDSCCHALTSTCIRLWADIDHFFLLLCLCISPVHSACLTDLFLLCIHIHSLWDIWLSACVCWLQAVCLGGRHQRHRRRLQPSRRISSYPRAKAGRWALTGGLATPGASLHCLEGTTGVWLLANMNTMTLSR